MTLAAFGMPFLTLAFMAALAFGIARYNRKPASSKDGGYFLEAAKVTWRWK
jgi:hypothetical protein